jgi:hypothetical protein
MGFSCSVGPVVSTGLGVCATIVGSVPKIERCCCYGESPVAGGSDWPRPREGDVRSSSLRDALRAQRAFERRTESRGA